MFELILTTCSIPVLGMLALFSLFYYMDKYDASTKVLKEFLGQLLLVRVLRQIIFKQGRLDRIVAAIRDAKTGLNRREMIPHTTRILVALMFIVFMLSYMVDIVRNLEQNQYASVMRKSIFALFFTGIVLLSLRFGNRLGQIESKHKR